MSRTGIAPARSLDHQPLKLARLLVSSPRQKMRCPKQRPRCYPPTRELSVNLGTRNSAISFTQKSD